MTKSRIDDLTVIEPRPDERQVGGDHYKSKKLTPWEVIDATFTHEEAVGFYKGNAFKYLMRYKDKGGVEDLKKCEHYMQKLIEVLG